MPTFGPATSPSAVGRTFLGAATVLTALLGLTGDARWFAASGAFGTVWWAWDFLSDSVFGPLGSWLLGILTGSATVEEPPDLTLDDTIRLLEDHLTADGVTRHVQIQAALRLSEIYRLNQKDPVKAKAVIERVRARWPDAPELRLFERESEK
jgi:Na+-transporting NADH:ubiquinone oxidoreductase subunit NqrB